MASSNRNAWQIARSNVGSTDDSLSDKKRGSIHDEIYLALGYLKTFMRIFGHYTIDETHSANSMSSVIDGLQFSWTSYWMLVTISSLGGVTTALLSVLLDYTLLIPNLLESVVITTYCTCACISSYINVISCVLHGSHWPSYFKRWQEVDHILDITLDTELRWFVRKVAVVVTMICISVVAGATLTISSKYVYKDEDFTQETFPLGAICFQGYLNGCQIVPEVVFVYLCKAVSIRFQRLSRDIQTVFKHSANSAHGPLDLTNELNRFRIIYQKLLDIIQHTNLIFGPVLLVTATQNLLTLSGGTYFLLRQTVNNIGIIIIKAALIVSALARIITICLYANQLKIDVDIITKNLCQAPIINMTKDSTEELKLFLKTIKIAKPEIHAMDFVTLDKGYLNQVASISVTYTFTLLQFDQDYEEGSNTNDCQAEEPVTYKSHGI